MKSLSFLIWTSLFCSTAFAQYQADLPLPKGARIVVDTYDSETKTFAVFSSKFPCEGYSYVTFDALAKAAGDVNDVRSDPKKATGKEFDTTAELATVVDGKIKTNHGAQLSGSLKKLCSAR